MQAMSVSGPIDAAELGIVLPHEHLYLDMRFLAGRPDDSRDLADVPIEELRRFPMRFPANLEMKDEVGTVMEVEAFRSAGGRTMAELTPIGLGRDPQGLARLAELTDTQIIMGTGYYVRASHPHYLSNMTVDEIAGLFVREIEDGIDGVRAGVIGEIGTSDPLDPQEASIVRAAAIAQLMTGCPINLHFASGCREVFRVLELIQSVGVTDLSRVVVSHMDVVLDLEQQRAVAELGAIVEYDTFGHENYPDSRGSMMPRDEERIEGVAQLVEWGLGPSVLVSQDVCLRSLLHSLGGKGYDNVLTRIVPMMHAAGINDASQTTLLVSNPGRIFAFASAPVEGSAESPTCV